jgi:SSS family solute:Na+ symporter
LNSSSTNIAVILPIAIYLIATIVVGHMVRRFSKSSSQFLHARGSLPTAIAALSFLAANCGALEIVGIFTAAAKYGALALHFYWVGAIPAMIFLGLFMMPIYVRSGAMTVPDFLRLRYNNATHILSALSLATMMVLVSGISLYAISSVLGLFFGWNFLAVVVVTAAVVLCYTFAGGLRATIYNEIFQFALTIVSLLPLTYKVLHDFHGIGGLIQQLPNSMRHMWITMPLLGPKNGAMDVFGVVFGLGFVLSCGYWCTDFVLIQRALTAKTVEGCVNTPLLAAIGKLLFPCVMIVPGIAAVVFLRTSPNPRFDQALPLLIHHYYGSALLGLGTLGILASLMSGLGGNITAFSTLCTHDLYRTYVRPRRDDRHYVMIARILTVLATCLSILSAYIALRYNNLMDYLQLVFSLFNAPLFATFLLGMFTVWATPGAGFCGLLSGVIAACLHNVAVRHGWLGYGSQMTANFYAAIWGWTTCIAVTAIVSLFTPAKTREELKDITYLTQRGARVRISPTSWMLAALVLSACALLNFIFR